MLVRPYQMIPIRRVDIFRGVLAEIDAYIRRNNLQPGERLPSDRQLADMLHVSRPIVRQAIKVLEGLGILEAHHGSGTYVRARDYSATVAQLSDGLHIDRHYLRQVEATRNAVELEVMVEAFEHRSAENLAHVQRSIDDARAALEANPEQTTLVLGLESALGDICGNEPLRRVQTLLHELWIKAELDVGEVTGDELVFQEEHVRIFDSFRNGDLVSALALFRDHLKNVPPG